jgi:glutathione S-transferase
MPDAYKEITKANIGNRLDFLSKALQGKDYLMGSTFMVADAYLFVILGWSGHLGIDLAKWPVMQAYWDRIAARPAVKAALDAEAKAAA